MCILSLKLAGFGGSGVRIRLNLRGGISSQGPEILILTYKVALSYSIF